MFDEKALKAAFSRVKQDIFLLGEELSQLRTDISEIKEQIAKIQENISSTHISDTSTHPVTSTHTSTHPYEIEGLKYPNFDISTGNEGASTDRQTIRQTDNPLQKPLEKPIDQTITEASEILDSLDDIKKEIRLKFKSITNQEMLVFSTIYQLEEDNPDGVSYDQISAKLSLSQSSIRDYIQRLINKGIPIYKTRVNNKKITLKISSELKKIAPLSTILKLREI